MSEKVYVGRKVQSFESKGEYEPFSRVTMWRDDDHSYTAGDDTGRTLECQNPWATQEMADNVLKQVKGYAYRPYAAQGADLDPAAEVGDAVTVCGVYSVLGGITWHYDAQGSADITAPGEQEIDHEYPYINPQDRELTRRVKLEQPYYGTKISRREGLVIEKTDGQTVVAKVVLNADELSFYDGSGNRVLYFDPATGSYKFTGTLNVSDHFVVDKEGNVKMSGNLNLSAGALYWGDNAPVKYQFAESTSGPWHDTMRRNDKYRRDSLNGGTTWGDPYQFLGEDGKNGSDGMNGSDASVTFENVKRIMEKYYGVTTTQIDPESVYSPYIYGANLIGTNVFGGAYWDSNGRSKLVLNPSGSTSRNADLVLYSGENIAFSVRDEITGHITLSSYRHAFIVTGADGSIPQGIWDFSNAIVKGLSATFA